MTLLPDTYLSAYAKRQRLTLEKHLARLERSKSRVGDAMRWATITGAVASSQIEGSRVSVEDYVQATTNGKKPNRDVREVEDLVQAYGMAQRTKLTSPSLLEAHATLAATIYASKEWTAGEWRTGPVYVVGGNAQGRYKVYEGPPATDVPKLMARLMRDAAALEGSPLSTTEAFYYAAMLHLQFVKIHPFNDGNGRTGRLLEKWFLAQHIGPVAWLVNSELYYRMHLQQYYDALRRLGPVWKEEPGEQCVPFLLLLPKGLRQK